MLVIEVPRAARRIGQWRVKARGVCKRLVPGCGGGPRQIAVAALRETIVD